MPTFYTRYQQGHEQEVYAELLAMQAHIYDPAIFADALLVMQEIMRRVRSNVEILLSRLHTLGFLFRKGGFWEDLSAEHQEQLKRDFPTFQPSTRETREQVAALERLVGPLPLSLKCFYEEVGSVNLIGLFPANERSYGCVLDPLCIESVNVALQVVTGLQEDFWEAPLLMLAGDCYHKYGYSGTGAYSIRLPCRAIDAPFLDEPHNTTFVNYLRICMQWGGFPGLEQECHLSANELTYLTQGLQTF